MKILQIVQKYFTIVGISPSNQSMTNDESIKKKIFVGLLLFGYPTISQAVYIIDGASGFIEYMECVCVVAASTIVSVCFSVIVFRTTMIFESIQSIETLIDTSESIFNKLIFY